MCVRANVRANVRYTKMCAKMHVIVYWYVYDSSATVCIMQKWREKKWLKLFDFIFLVWLTHQMTMLDVMKFPIYKLFYSIRNGRVKKSLNLK